MMKYPRINPTRVLLLLSLFLSIATASSAFSQTRAIGGSAVGVDYCWALDSKNYPYLTSDSGLTWVKKPKISGKKIVSIDALNVGCIWALTEDGRKTEKVRVTPQIISLDGQMKS